MHLDPIPTRQWQYIKQQSLDGIGFRAAAEECFADKAAIVVATSEVWSLPLSNSQNLATDQALAAMPPVATLVICEIL